MKKILMVCYGAGHVKIIENIYNELIKEKNLKIEILALTTAQNYLKEKKIPYKKIENYYKKYEETNIFEIGKKFIENLKLEYNDFESILYYGYSISELYEKFGEVTTIEAYKKYGRWIFLPINFAKKVLEYEKPDILITTTSPRMEKAFLLAAKYKNIKSIYIDDMLGLDNNTKIEIIEYLNDKNYEPNFGDYNFVSCEYAKENLLKFTKNKIIVTGQPNFDVVQNYDKKTNDNLNIETSRKIITLLSQPYEDQKEYLLKVFEVLDKKDYYLILKKHPNEKENYNILLNNFKNLKKNSLVLEKNLYESILKSDLIVHRNSTSALEANILGKYIIGEKTQFLEHEKLGLGWEYRTINELDFLIDKFFVEKDNLKIKKIFKIKNASKRIKEEIMKII